MTTRIHGPCRVKKTVTIPLESENTLFYCARNCTNVLGDVQTVASQANRSATEDGEHVEGRELYPAVFALRDRVPTNYGCSGSILAIDFKNDTGEILNTTEQFFTPRDPNDDRDSVKGCPDSEDKAEVIAEEQKMEEDKRTFYTIGMFEQVTLEQMMLLRNFKHQDRREVAPSAQSSRPSHAPSLPLSPPPLIDLWSPPYPPPPPHPPPAPYPPNPPQPQHHPRPLQVSYLVPPPPPPIFLSSLQPLRHPTVSPQPLQCPQFLHTPPPPSISPQLTESVRPHLLAPHLLKSPSPSLATTPQPSPPPLPPKPPELLSSSGLLPYPTQPINILPTALNSDTRHSIFNGVQGNQTT
ncbi:hypothetical protein PILCRDRAFT_12413 [Piloderma croceum F 1598]|uniref:Uncharacterized protein n=1 Tax=Piloderma croceum (strain F 1598) TaxID=765440 RepID=A0A0C3BHL4_PILCF|nr:hypothetical protein PILCRDRAFT_12413 [Piloderma croceum F 1598]